MKGVMGEGNQIPFLTAAVREPCSLQASSLVDPSYGGLSKVGSEDQDCRR